MSESHNENPMAVESQLPVEDVVSLALRLREHADSYFADNETLADDDRALLRIFTKLCLAHQLTGVQAEKYKDVLASTPAWDALVLERARLEKFTPDEMEKLQNMINSLPMFALGLVSTNGTSMSKKLEEKMLTTVKGKTNAQRVYQASHD